MALVSCKECASEVSDKAASCPKCGAPIAGAQGAEPTAAPLVAKRESKSEMAGVGCLIQVVGLAVIWIWPIGTVFGVVLLIYGSMRAQFYRCGNCKNRLTDKAVKLCPSCGATLK